MSRMSRMSRARLLLVTSLFALVPLVVEAGGTQTHAADSFDEFDSGEVEGAAIEGSGKLTRGYATSKADIKASVAFSCLSDGKQAWVGTADDATIQTVKLQGKTPAVEQLAKLEGVVVSAMARLPGGDLVVASLPGGKLLRVDAKGKVSDFAELKVETIWTIVPHAGRLLIGTGPEGELWSIGTDGKDAKVVLDTPDKDVLTIATIGEAIVVGTAPKARLYMVDAKLEGVLLHEFTGDELRALAVSGNTLVAAVNDFEDRGISSRQALTSQLNRASLTGEKPQDSNTDRPRASADTELWAIDLGPKRDILRAQDGAWDKWLSKAGQYFIDLLAVDDKGTVLAASSAGGRIYRVRGHRDVAVVADLEQRQATALCALPDGDVLATAGDGAAVHVLQAKAPAAKARWVSKVYDAKRPARYGAFVLEAKGKVELRVRTGPTAEVDARWSEWKSISLTREGTQLRGSGDLPQRRYLQVEVSLVDADAELRGFTVFHAPENLGPRVEAIDVDPPSFSFSDDDETKSTIKIGWEVEAVDGDDMIYDLRIRPEGGGDDEWIKLNQDGPLDKKEFTLDLDTLPDGVYELQLRASDEPAVGSAAARSDVLISEPFVVDRTRPTLEGVKLEGARITGLAKDQGGFVHDVAFALDGGGFRAASPSDGIFDSASERFEIALPDDLAPGKHRVVVRARDSRGNLETFALELP